MRSMDEILSSAPAKSEATGGDVAAKVAEQADVTAKDVVVEGEKPAAAKPEPVTPASAKDTSDKKDTVDAHEDAEDEHVPDSFEGFKKALSATRGDKRKLKKQYREVEMQLAEFKGRYSTLEQQLQRQAAIQQPPEPIKPEPVKAPPPDITDDNFYLQGPKTIKDYVEHRFAALDGRLNETRAEYDRRVAELRTDIIRENARRRHSDYDEVTASFKGKEPPHVAADILNSADPAERLYEYAKAFREFSGVDSVDAFRAKIEADVRAKVEDEYAAKSQAVAPQHQAPKPPVPQQSLAGARGNGFGKPAVWSGPRSLEQIVG
jgi:hypothetical protein